MEPIAFDEETEAAAPDALTYWGRAGTLLFVAAWGAYLASLDYRYNAIGQSFMHAILLPIHEAGHVLFRPFGEFMTVLGGSLFQVSLPFAIGVAFLWRQHDAFGAAICLWWTGASLVDLAPYIWDSLDPQIVLLGGRTGEDGGHDWIYLLGRFNAIPRAHAYGAFAHHLGTLAMAGAVGWGIWWLVKKRPQAKGPS